MRDMEEELGRKEASLRQMVVSRDKAQQDYERYAEQCEKLDQDIEAAIEKGAQSSHSKPRPGDKGVSRTSGGAEAPV
jgi:phage shock protein A